MDAFKGEYCVVYIYNANSNAMIKAYRLFHILSFQGKTPQNPETISIFLQFDLRSGRRKSPLQVERFNDFMEKINLCEFLQRDKTGLSSLVNDYQSLNTQV